MFYPLKLRHVLINKKADSSNALVLEVLKRNRNQNETVRQNKNSKLYTIICQNHANDAIFKIGYC